MIIANPTITPILFKTLSLSCYLIDGYKIFLTLKKVLWKIKVKKRSLDFFGVVEGLIHGLEPIFNTTELFFELQNINFDLCGGAFGFDNVEH
jgi:hypothetical protein